MLHQPIWADMMEQSHYPAFEQAEKAFAGINASHASVKVPMGVALRAGNPNAIFIQNLAEQLYNLLPAPQLANLHAYAWRLLLRAHFHRAGQSS
jgi:hypothetical protein